MVDSCHGPGLGQPLAPQDLRVDAPGAELPVAPQDRTDLAGTVSVLVVEDMQLQPVWSLVPEPLVVGPNVLLVATLARVLLDGLNGP